MAGDTENFAQYFALSQNFENIYKAGMELVDSASNYLEGDGRVAVRVLSRDLSLTYASESMRLTTRLMQLAAWLMVQRSVREGEMSLEEALHDKYRLNTNIHKPADDQTLEQLPAQFRKLVRQSYQLEYRVSLIDNHLRDDKIELTTNDDPLADTIADIETAFGVQADPSSDSQEDTA